MILNKSDNNSIEICSKILLNNGVVIIPTDTVYGFSTVVTSSYAQAKINSKKITQLKGRDENKPFIQLIGNKEDLFNYTFDKIPDFLLSYWPGPLTIIVNNKDKTSTTAFRCPSDKWLLSLLNEVKLPIYSTSVNYSGLPILEKISDIKKEFSNKVDLIIEGGDRINCSSSTIVKIENDEIKVLRQGELVIKEL